MKRLAFFLTVFTLASAVAHAAQNESLYERFRLSGTVLYAVEDPTAVGEVKNADLPGLKSEIAKTLEGRKSLTFKPADDPLKADVTVEVEVRELHWSPVDPVDMLVGVGAIALDTARQEHYGRMQANVSVKDKAGRVVWKDKLISTITDNSMSEADAPARLNASLSQLFVREAFGKKTRARR